MSIWGNTTLKILVDSLRPGHTPGSLTEIALLPDPANLGSISTVVQQQGRKRKRVRAKLYVASMSEYDALVYDMNLGIQKMLSIDDTTVNAIYVIEEVGEPEFIQNNVTFFDVTWVEV